MIKRTAKIGTKQVKNKCDTKFFWSTKKSKPLPVGKGFEIRFGVELFGYSQFLADAASVYSHVYKINTCFQSGQVNELGMRTAFE